MEVRLESGDGASVTAFDGNVLTLLSPKAFAPGAPIRFQSIGAELERGFEGRTIGSKRTDDGAFEVRLRLINLRRADREFLMERFGA